jgi:tRNA (guanine37-N1)-methyltransferase
MKQFDICTIFPEAVVPYTQTSILARASQKGIACFSACNIRDFSRDRHKSVDDIPFGGGAGMVMKPEPIFEAVESCIEKSLHEDDRKRRILLFSAKGKQFTQKDAQRLSEYEHIIGICGRYEGVDERVREHLADEEISIGSYVLTGGELAALVVCDAIVRLLPGVLGNPHSLEEESHGEVFDATYPQYTRPRDFRGWKVPDVLLEGNHAEIDAWRQNNAVARNGKAQKNSYEKNAN